MFCTSEQKFFELNGFMPPKRCRGCRAEQREKRERKQSRATREREPYLRCGVWRNTDDSGHWRLAVMLVLNDLIGWRALPLRVLLVERMRRQWRPSVLNR